MCKSPVINQNDISRIPSHYHGNGEACLLIILPFWECQEECSFYAKPHYNQYQMKRPEGLIEAIYPSFKTFGTIEA
jgi:hypothetical protein